MWYGFRDSVNGELLLDQDSPFENIELSTDLWKLSYTNGALAFGYLIGLNIVNGVGVDILYSYELTPEATSPTGMVWGFRDDGIGGLFFETVNPLAGESVPRMAWNMFFGSGALAYGAHGIFEFVPDSGAGIVLNY
jgi:hypothetical protein